MIWLPTLCTSVWHGAHPQSEMGVRNTRDMRTTGECLDVLIQGNLPALGDILMQRLKALEQAVKDGNWNTAAHLEVVPSLDVGLTSQRELRSAVQGQLQQYRLKEARGRSKPP